MDESGDYSYGALYLNYYGGQVFIGRSGGSYNVNLGGNVYENGTLLSNRYAKKPTATTTDNFLIMGPNKTSVTTTMLFHSSAYVTSAAQVNAPEFRIAEKATLKYDSARQAVKFVFS